METTIAVGLMGKLAAKKDKEMYAGADELKITNDWLSKLELQFETEIQPISKAQESNKNAIG